MVGKKIKHTLISSESSRRSTLKKRLEGLLKKANELTILCEADVGLVVHCPEESNAFIWPSRDGFNERLRRFMQASESDRSRKMITHDEYLMERIKKETQIVERLEKKNDEKEMLLLMDEAIEGKHSINDFDLRQMRGLQLFALAKLEMLHKRSEELNKERQGNEFPSLIDQSSHSKEENERSNEPMVEDMRKDQWFMETMSNSIEPITQGALNGLNPYIGGSHFVASNAFDLNWPNDFRM